MNLPDKWQICCLKSQWLSIKYFFNEKQWFLKRGIFKVSFFIPCFGLNGTN